MKRFLFIFVTLIICLVINANGVIKLTISDGIDNLELKAKIERNSIKLLNEINAAYTENRTLDFSKMEVKNSVLESLTMLWENSPFKCTDDAIVEHCITTGTGYQIRNIPLEMKPTGKREFNEDEYQEAVISFDKQGNVESFYLSISMNLYMNVIKSNLELADLRCRQIILDYIEQFRTAYSQKDIVFLSKVYLDDGLVVMKMLKDSRKNKKKHLRHLSRAFKHDQEVKVKLDDIEVIRHPINPNMYGVTIKLQWTIDEKQEGGYFFQLWDFMNESSPMIHICTLQNDTINGRPLSSDEVFSLSDFDM